MSRAQPKICLDETTDILTAPQLQRLWWHIAKESTLRVSNSIETRENNERFICPCVHFSEPPKTHSPSMKGKNRMRLSYPRTSMINACPSLFLWCFFNTFWFLFSTIISFLVFPPSICHLWRWRNDTKTSNHIFYVITFHLIISSSIFYPPLRTVRRETFSYLFPQLIRQTDRCSTSKLASILSKRFFLPWVSEDKLKYKLHELYTIYEWPLAKVLKMLHIKKGFSFLF